MQRIARIVLAHWTFLYNHKDIFFVGCCEKRVHGARRDPLDPLHPA